MTTVVPNPLAEGLHDYHVGEPCLMVIFGATGDLSGRKLLPALYNLSKQRLLPAGFAVVGAAIDDMTDESFRKHASEKITQFSRTQPIDQRVLDAFVSSCFYVKVDFGKLDDFKTLQRRLAELDTTRHVAGNRMFYCATPPPTYETIVEQLKAAAMIAGDGFHRIVVEKPFGSDLKSARELTDILQRVFHEDEVYRIDHYLGKETVQNIMAFRFANSIFEPVWNANHIDSVQITVAEEIGVELRGAYYEKAGALRDIVQNHALQLVALVAMEPPLAFEANAVRDEKVKVLRSLHTPGPKSVVRGLYGRGFVEGVEVAGKIDAARSSRELSVREATLKFGQSCPLAGSFPAALQCAVHYADDFSGALRATAAVGGDNAARAAMIGSLLGASLGIQALPVRWSESLAAREEIANGVEWLVRRSSDEA